MHKIFEYFDVNGDGELQIDEFQNIMRDMRIGIPEIRVVELFNAFDVDGGGSISFQEFMRLIFPQGQLNLEAYEGKDQDLKQLNEQAGEGKDKETAQV